MVDFARGDVILCDLNPVMGTEQAGIRPVLVFALTQPVRIQSLRPSPRKFGRLCYLRMS